MILLFTGPLNYNKTTLETVDGTFQGIFENLAFESIEAELLDLRWFM